ncbi:MAG: hypothetical protein ACT443_13480 [Gemmatimonadota bacterium]
MRFRSRFLTALMLFASAATASAQDKSFEQELDQFIKGLFAERAELDKVDAQLKEIDEKIAQFRACSELLKEAGGLGGKTGLAAKIAMKAKCGATSEDGYLKDRRKLFEKPEKIGAKAAGMKEDWFAHMKERYTPYVAGSRDYPRESLQVLAARAEHLARGLGMTLSKASGNEGGNGGGGIGARVGSAIAGRVRMFTPDMTWAYVSYLWGLMYMSGATMFETAYQPGEWTRWEIKDSEQADTKTVLERALLSREADGSEWWRIKSIAVGPETADTITLESQFKKLDESGIAMQVVRMRGKLPGDTEGKELMVPQHLSMLSMTAFPFKPTPESIQGATVGTELVKVGASSYSAKHVKFGAGGGNMEWWLADQAPGGVARVQFSGQQADEQWTMELVDAGSGAKSELGVK